MEAARRGKLRPTMSVMTETPTPWPAEADKLVLSRAGMYVGRGYLVEGLFKLNVQTFVVREPNVVPIINNNSPTFAYIIESLIYGMTC